MSSKMITLEIVDHQHSQFDVVAVDGLETKLEASYVGNGGVARFWTGLIHVDEGLRRQGVARSMVAKALEVAFARYPTATHAYVDASTTEGVQFFTSLGFECCAPVEDWPYRGRPMWLRLR